MGVLSFLKDLFGPRKPCALCRLGQSSWSSDRSGVADWKIRGHGLDAELLICGGCRQFLLENGLERKTPMWGLAHLVAVGRAQRPSLSAYLQHQEWRKIWLHILDRADQRPSDEFEALSMMEPLEEEFMSRAGVDATRTSEKSTGPDPTDPDSRDPMSDPRLRRMMEEHGIPEDVIQRKYRSYSLVLQGQDGNWNADIDDHAREIGALTEDEIRAIRTDFHQAVLNRVKVALVAEGYAPSLETRSDDSGAGEKSGQEFREGVPDPFPDEIDVPGDDSGLVLPPGIRTGVSANFC